MGNRIILVTGANRGIGYSIVQVLGQQCPGATLIVASRSKDNVEAAVDRLRELGLKAKFHPVELDVTSDDSIKAAVREVGERFGRLDVLVNNAGIAGSPSSDNSDFRMIYNEILNTNVTSVALVSTLFLPLLRKAENPRVINIGSARGSLTLVTSGANPPTDKIPYSISKAALNLLTVEMSHSHPDVEFQVVNPGWCKTAFNGYRGPKDPLEGALSIVELAVTEKGKYSPGFWAHEEGKMEKVPW